MKNKNYIINGEKRVSFKQFMKMSNKRQAKYCAGRLGLDKERQEKIERIFKYFDKQRDIKLSDKK